MEFRTTQDAEWLVVHSLNLDFAGERVYLHHRFTESASDGCQLEFRQVRVNSVISGR
jgi:hypothetical protein